jgi:hypothetical protein
MLGVVLGNGPSKRLYDRSGDFTLGCNIPGPEFSVDATVICDEEIIWILKNDPTVIDCPIIISNKAYEKLKELRLDNHFVIHHVFKVKEWYNTAHYAADYLAEFGCDEIDHPPMFTFIKKTLLVIGSLSSGGECGTICSIHTQI